MRMRRTQSEVRVEITPLIDVVFLLLTFFVFSLVLLVRADALGITLPALSGARPAQPGPTVTIAITSDGDYRVDSDEVALGEIADRVRDARIIEPDSRILMSVDARAPAEALLQVIDLFRSEGIEGFSVIGNRVPRSTPSESGSSTPAAPEPAPDS